jgi:Family of unknown function (DUF6455)
MQEDLMKIGSAPPSEKAVERDESEGLLDCRMAMLGLDFDAIKRSDGETLAQIVRECTRCGAKEACVVDLKRDPNSPVWETYCPNAEALIALAKERWEKGSS